METSQIAIVRFSALGDLILCSSAVQSLANQLPNTQILWITSTLSQKLFEFPGNVIVQLIDKPSTLRSYYEFWSQHKAKRYECILAMQASLRINLLYPLLRSKHKIGFDRTRARDGHALFTHERIPTAHGHLLDGFYQFLEPLKHHFPDTNINATPTDSWPILTDYKADQEAKERLESSERWIAIAPCASKSERDWPTHCFEECILSLLLEYNDVNLVLVGGRTEKEQHIGQHLMQKLPPHAGKRVLNTIGTTTLPQLSSILKQCDALIAPDTGPVHLARALKIPVVGLYAVARPELTGPYKATEFCVNKYPAAVETYLGYSYEMAKWHTRVHHPKAMSLITVNEVLQQVANALNFHL